MIQLNRLLWFIPANRVMNYITLKQFVFLDSITTVLLYNSLPRTLEFSNFLTNTLRESKVVGMVVSVSKGITNEKLFKELEKASDEVIKF
jgi:archaellum biogenesis ATPase FlaH